MLNTNYFGILSSKRPESIDQLEWLKTELDESEMPVILLMHIPPGFSMFDGGEEGWHEDYTNIFIEILKRNEDKVKFILAGHRHSGTFKIIPETKLPIMVHPALSPIFSNNPSFRYYNNSDYTDYILNLYIEDPEWSIEYSFMSFFETQTLDFEAIYQDLASDDDKLNEFLRHTRGVSQLKSLTNQEL